MDEMTVAEVQEAITNAERNLTAEIGHELKRLAGQGIYPHAIDVELVGTRAVGEKRTQYHLGGVSIRVEVL